jgi:hypothetical protein
MFVWHCGSPFLYLFNITGIFATLLLIQEHSSFSCLLFLSSTGFSQHDPFTFPWDVQLTGATAVCNIDPNRSCPSAKTGMSVPAKSSWPDEYITSFFCFLFYYCSPTRIYCIDRSTLVLNHMRLNRFKSLVCKFDSFQTYESCLTETEYHIAVRLETWLQLQIMLNIFYRREQVSLYAHHQNVSKGRI